MEVLPPSVVLPSIGDAATAIFLLRDYEKFGLADRVCYHFDLTEALTVSEDASSSSSDGPHTTVCGVYSLLECAPVTPWHRLTKRQKRALKSQLRGFNMAAEKVRQERSVAVHKPKELPLQLTPSTRMFFAYEVTRIAFCVDASPSLTSTFGVTGSSSSHCCPLDRLPEMARTFFNSLVEPVSAPSMADSGIWRPILSVTVIAVFPLGKTAETSLLVRDYRVDSVESAQILAAKIDEWIHSEVEIGISERMGRRCAGNAWAMPLYSSSLRDILEAGDYALSVLSSEARPLIVVATDGRSVSCDGIVDVFLDIDRVDVPVIILDLSMSETHAMEEQPRTALSGENELNFLSYDPGGPSAFPLHLSDDSEALYGVCRATGGCFLNSHLLTEASTNIAGQQPVTDTPYHYSFKRRFVKMNGVQWLTLFSLSPLSPTFHSSWGKLAPPHYLKKRLSMGMVDTPAAVESQSVAINFSKHDNFSRHGTDLRRSGVIEGSPAPHRRSLNHSRTTFSTYVISPIRIKALLLMRIKEGYRAKQYGLSTQDADKVFIQFTLPLELGTILHYELSYRASSSQNHMIGSAHIKIELSGDPGFTQSVKNNFLRQGPDSRPFTMSQKVSARLCQVLRWIRKEDCLQSYLCPPSKWSDHLSTSDSPFVKRLGSMTPLQRRRHFQFDEFDVICTGRLPYALDDGFLSEFISVENGEQELLEELNEWSDQIVNEKSRYVKRTSTTDGMTAYCLLELRQSSIASRLFSMSVQFYGGTDPRDRLDLLTALKQSLNDLKDVEVLSKQMGPFLVGTSNNAFCKQRNVEFQYHHARWDLVKDPELLPLVMKRRTEIGRFRLLQSSDDHSIFAKLVPEAVHALPGDLVQYQIAILSDKVVVDLHMESECGVFFPFRLVGREAVRFNGIVHVLRRRDQECGRALRSRTNLLSVFPTEHSTDLVLNEESHHSSVQRILQYSSIEHRRLRFFNPGAGSANDILFQTTERLLLSGSFGGRAAKLKIGPNEWIKDEDSGLWLVVQFDRHTMSIVHLSLVDKEDEGTKESETQTYRDMTFFTSGISDLYSKRDDMADDDSTESHISEYLCVSEFADHFEIAQRENFAAAAYLALRHDVAAPVESFDQKDFSEVLLLCRFLEVTSVLIAGSGFSTSEHQLVDETSKLTRLINTILLPVPGDDECMFYSGDGDTEALLGLTGNESDSLASSNVSIDMSQQTGVLEEAELDHPTPDDILYGSSGELQLGGGLDEQAPPRLKAYSPVFVRFKLDGEPASLKDLNAIRKSTNLAAEISVFKNEVKGSKAKLMADAGQSSLPWSHQVVAVELTALLKSYVAEQTIERLRHHGTSISDENVWLVKKCLKRVRSVVSISIEVYFYVSKTDLMVPTSAPAGGESEVEEGFQLLTAELRENRDLAFESVADGGFFVSSIENGDRALGFWCFVYVQDREGLVSVQIYHPEGGNQAMDVMSKVHDVVYACIHRVNQQLLLKSLHRNRTASILLLPQQGAESENADSHVIKHPERFAPGVFGCPVVFQTVFDLYHRCATNPSQAAHTLEATVLHSFAVSNRQGIFVYKDEAGGIFYMVLQAKGSGLDADGQVELLVHGIGEPGPSVTMQLRELLQRRLLLIAVDMLSSVLTKNPHFNWKHADFEFLKSFENDWKSLEREEEMTSDQECYYEFPSEVLDPCMVLLIFRQNICGSTFIHRTNDMGNAGLSPAVTASHLIESGGTALKWNNHHFTLYYNNAASKLDPSFQGVSTLTDRGATLCRQAGMGIAMIEVGLVKSNGTPVDKVSFGKPATLVDAIAEVPTASLRFRKLDYFPQIMADPVCVRVKITATALNREYLHEWLALTLDQALIAWEIERLLERTSLGLYRPLCETLSAQGGTKLDPKVERNTALDVFCPGLPALASILESSHGLPHPAITKIENHGVIRSSSVATTTLELLENSILTPLFADSKTKEPVELAKGGLRIIRLSRSVKPELVRLTWDATRRKALVTMASTLGSQHAIEDSPIDCPEYICFYCLSHFREASDSIDAHLRLYRAVMIHDNISDNSATIELLESIKKRNPSAFFRSFAFIFSVKRNRRSLWTYNWNPLNVKSVSARLLESDLSCVREAGRSAFSLQHRSLRFLAPSAGFKDAMVEKTIKRLKHETPRTESARSASGEKIPRPQDGQRNGPARKIRRPISIRRPQLVGKSVEGAAMQAVAASRKRASSNQFKNAASSSAPVRRPPGSARESARTTSSKSNASIGDMNAKSAPRPPPSVRGHKEIEDRDEILARVKSDFTVLCSWNHSQLCRLSSVQRAASVIVADVWWPRKPNQTIPRSVGDFILSKAPKLWSDACVFPPLPRGMLEIFVPVFARWVAAFTPTLEILPSISQKVLGLQVNSILLSSSIKNVRCCKCLAVVKITKLQKDTSHEAIVRCEGWVVNLPRRSRIEQRKKNDANVTSLLLQEKDSAGMDKLTSDLRGSLVLESLLFDFSASMVERAARLLDERINLDDLVPTLRTLLTRYPLERQKRMSMLNYRVFEATIVLKSYRARMIDMFDAEALFQRMYMDAEARDVTGCGAGLCFKRGINVKGSHSICFLTLHPTEVTKMQLLILCRTQGRNLSDYMFRDGSNVAIHILDNIVYEAAGLAFNELKFFSEKLRKDALWKLFSSKATATQPKQAKEDIFEMLTLTRVRPLIQVLGNNLNGFLPEILSLFGPDSGINWIACCRSMKREPCFIPNWALEDKECITNLFFVELEDIFLLIGVASNGALLRADLVEKDESVTLERRQMALQRFINYILRFIWHGL